MANSPSHFPQTLQKHTARFRYIQMIGTSLGKPCGDVFVNTVGTFGVASASYYWSRVAGSIGRLLQYLSGHSSTSWHMLVADDYLLESGVLATVLGFFYSSCSVLSLAYHYHDIRRVGEGGGGDTLVWVGFEILLRSHSVGISSRRAEWFVRWAEKVASSTTIHMASFQEGLGRIMFVAGALEHERQVPHDAPAKRGPSCPPVRVFHTQIPCRRDIKKRGITNAVPGLRHPIVHRGSTRKLAKNVLE